MVIKTCNICQSTLDESHFPRNKYSCRICYNKQYQAKYEKRRAAAKEKKDLELKAQVMKEYEEMTNENALLKVKIEELEEELAKHKDIDIATYEKIVVEHNKLINEQIKLNNKIIAEQTKRKELIDVLRTVIKKHS